SPHVIGRGVRAYAARFQEALVPEHQVGIDLVQGHVISPEKTPETVHDRGVALGGTALPDLSQLLDNIPGEGDESPGIRRREVTSHYLFGSVVLAGLFETQDNVLEPTSIPTQGFPQ